MSEIKEVKSEIKPTLKIQEMPFKANFDLNSNFNEAIDFYEEPEATFSMHPKKFMLWLFIVSIVMIFASMTSAYIVRQSEGDWLQFALPDALWASTVVIIVSSFTAQWAYNAAKKDNIKNMKIAMGLTMLLGVTFLVLQVVACGEMIENNIYFGGVDRANNAVNPSGSFVYVLLFLHAVHLITGVIFLFLVGIAVFKYEVHSQATTRIQMSTIYWHFLGGLWVYLFIFLVINR